jgi:predicted Holliday junction resolvase-like endonuclease
VDVPDALLLLLVLLAGAGWALSFAALRRLVAARRGKRSQSARYGNITEQFAPWMARWPFDPSGFRFLGKPVDGVQFDGDAVYFVEIKAAGSRLSPEQQAVRAAVLAGRVGWVEFRASEDAAPRVERPWVK